MATTPRSSSPAKTAHTPERAVMDQSMMVGPPSLIEQSAQSPDDATVRLDPHGSPSRSQFPSAEEPPNGGHHKTHQHDHHRAQTPETQKRRNDRSEMPSPGRLAPFDWEDFEDRYEKALQEAGEKERQMLEEFAQLVKYFNVWASASSSHDNERAVKRLRTRERYVRLSEQSLAQKKQHLTEVVKAFQSALALLSAT
ncbi:putative DNA double-strand break repair Rad50 ATPase [Rosellinia necatrix]|uniref:Putative DNA double-strand break repair Rad50 ATPase n=1 Tax=Rosellinia necatrix TaxID=77044 RepID=A0A1S7UM25_ROSNE|nr:putative DNA double-strand break repair Rad50 ATPase [Rosellinia necatrix]